MYIDALLQFDDGDEHLAAGKSTNIIDVESARDVGSGTNLFLVLICTVAMTDVGDDSAMQVSIETDDDSAFPSGKITQVIGIFPALSAIGTKIIAKLDPKKIDEQFIRLDYSPTNGNLSTGKFSAFITNTVDNAVDYPIGYTI